MKQAEKIKEISDKLGWKRRSDGKIQALIDSAANQKTLAYNKSVSELFFENGIAVNPRVNKDIFSGIERVKQYLNKRDFTPKLYIFKNCVNLIREFKSYWWGDGDNPKKYDDHSLDELRYYLMTKPHKNPIKPIKTEIQKDKERLIRKVANERRQN